MIYDDGSYDEVINGVTYAFDTNGDVANATGPTGAYVATPGFYQDQRETTKLASFYPAGKTWWEGLATYGATRAIDAHFGPNPVQGNTAGTFAGQNGRTYAQGQVGLAGGSDGSGLILLALAGLAFYALAG